MQIYKNSIPNRNEHEPTRTPRLGLRAAFTFCDRHTEWGCSGISRSVGTNDLSTVLDTQQSRRTLLIEWSNVTQAVSDEVIDVSQ